MIKQWIHKRIQDRINKYCEFQYQQISYDDMVLGKGLFNFRCHENAIQQVKEGNAKDVVLCVYYDDGQVIVHFINQLEDGKYQDNTLGYKYMDISTHIIRKLSPDEYRRIYAVHDRARTNLVRLNSSWWERLFIKAEDIC